MGYVIHKSTRQALGESYSGPTWDEEPSLRPRWRAVYEDKGEALELARLLTERNIVGFEVSPQPTRRGIADRIAEEKEQSLRTLADRLRVASTYMRKMSMRELLMDASEALRKADRDNRERERAQATVQFGIRQIEEHCRSQDADVPSSTEVFIKGAKKSSIMICTYGELLKALEK